MVITWEMGHKDVTNSAIKDKPFRKVTTIKPEGAELILYKSYDHYKYFTLSVRGSTLDIRCLKSVLQDLH